MKLKKHKIRNLNDMFRILTLENYDRFTTDFLVMFGSIVKAKERREAEEKHLQELKERVELAEKEFQKAIDEYTSKNNI